jgi:hypothetical protein
MANIVVTTTADKINVDFGVYSSDLGFEKCSYNKNGLMYIRLTNDGYCSIYMQNDKEWQVNYDGVGIGLQVDSINGVAPTTATHLFELLRDM